MPSAITVAPVKPPASPDRTFRAVLSAPFANPSTQIAAFTAPTKAIVVTTAAVSAAHHGSAPDRRTIMNTSTANGIATSAIRKSPGVPLILSISGGSNGVSNPVSTPPAAILTRLSCDTSLEAIAWVNAQLLFADGRLAKPSIQTSALTQNRKSCGATPFAQAIRYAAPPRFRARDGHPAQ